MKSQNTTKAATATEHKGQEGKVPKCSEQLPKNRGPLRRSLACTQVGIGLNAHALCLFPKFLQGKELLISHLYIRASLPQSKESKQPFSKRIKQTPQTRGPGDVGSSCPSTSSAPGTRSAAPECPRPQPGSAGEQCTGCPADREGQSSAPY